MPKSVRPVPEDSPQAAPYLTVRNGSKAIDFYKRAFEAREVIRIDDPTVNGKVGHAELEIGRARIMLADEYAEMGNQSPDVFGGSPVGIYLYVEDVDDVAERAVKAGAKLVNPVEDQFYGDRVGKLVDPFGHVWWIASRKENLSISEQKKRAEENMTAKASS